MKKKLLILRRIKDLNYFALLHYWNCDHGHCLNIEDHCLNKSRFNFNFGIPAYVLALK